MYQSNYRVPQSSSVVYDTSYPVMSSSSYAQPGEDDRFFLGPLLVGGLAGGAIGYGLGANKNYGGCCPPPVMYVPQAPMYYPQQPMYYPQQQQQQQALTSSMAYNNNYYM